MSPSLCLQTRLRPPPTLGVFASILAAMFVVTDGSLADSVTLISSRIPMRDCEIQAIQNAQVFYIDPAGRRQKRAVEEVWALSFDEFEALDKAEQAITDRDYDAARKRLLEAMIATDSRMHQLWIRHRLNRVHDLREEYAEACAHLAEIFILDPDPYWARMEPRCAPAPNPDPGSTTYAAAREAMDALARADRAVKLQAIQQSIASMTAKLRPMLADLEKSYDGPAIEPGSTISGVLKSEIGKWSEAANRPTSPEAAESPAQVAPETERREPGPPPVAATTPAQPSSTPPGPESPEAIDALLREQRYNEALTLCEGIATELGNRDVAQFLFQFGEALRRTGKPRDAAVMYMRGAVLYPASSFAGPCLVETALLYRSTFNRPETARRLLERVASDAERAERPELAQRARTLLRDLEP
jgi:hypothetical protein